MSSGTKEAGNCECPHCPVPHCQTVEGCDTECDGHEAAGSWEPPIDEETTPAYWRALGLL